MIELRIEGLPADVDAACECIKQSFDVLSTSKDYPNRGSKSIRRFIRAEPKTGLRLDKAKLTWLISQLLQISHAELRTAINIPDTLAAYHDGYENALMSLARSVGIVPDFEPAPEPKAKAKHKPGRKKQKEQGFWLETESGPIHCLADPAMANDPDFRANVEAMAKAAREEADKSGGRSD